MKTALILATPVLAVLLGLSGPAAARDRPGTPNEEKAWACGNPLLDRPAICVTFANTANEKVKFETEYRLNGDKVDRRLLEGEGVKFSCFPSVYRGAANVDMTPACAGLGGSPYHGRTTTADRQHERPFEERAARWFSGIRSWQPDDIDVRYIPPQGFILGNVRPGDEYCFRFRARRVSDDVVSGAFSNWACANGRALPQKPSAPPKVLARLLKSEWDGTTSGRPFTYGVLVQWEGAERAGQYDVSAPGGEFEPKTLDGKARQVIIPVSMQVYARGGVPVSVCARNVSGSRCLRTLEAKLVEPTRERVGRRSGAVQAAKAVFPSRTEAAPAPTPAPSPAAAPAGITKVPEVAPERMSSGMRSAGASALRALQGLPDGGTAGSGGGLGIDPAQGMSSRMR